MSGSWVDDQRCGSGKFYYVNGDVYDGEWKAHVRHGLGTYTYADTGSRYVGMWKNGRRDGHGELVHTNHKFVGKFVDDKVSKTSWSARLSEAPTLGLRYRDKVQMVCRADQ